MLNMGHPGIENKRNDDGLSKLNPLRNCFNRNLIIPQHGADHLNIIEMLSLSQIPMPTGWLQQHEEIFFCLGVCQWSHYNPMF